MGFFGFGKDKTQKREKEVGKIERVERRVERQEIRLVNEAVSTFKEIDSRPCNNEENIEENVKDLKELKSTIKKLQKRETSIIKLAMRLKKDIIKLKKSNIQLGYEVIGKLKLPINEECAVIEYCRMLYQETNSVVFCTEESIKLLKYRLGKGGSVTAGLGVLPPRAGWGFTPPRSVFDYFKTINANLSNMRQHIIGIFKLQEKIDKELANAGIAPSKVGIFSRG